MKKNGKDGWMNRLINAHKSQGINKQMNYIVINCLID